MKPQTLARLDLLAAAREAALLDTLARHTATLRRGEEQCAVLAAYQTRMRGLWQSGAPVRAGQAQRAGEFSRQAQAAQEQLQAGMVAARSGLAQAGEALARLRGHRRKLAARLAQARARDAELAERRAQQNQPYRRAPSFSSQSFSSPSLSFPQPSP